MILWLFSISVLTASAVAALTPRMRTSILALWISGLGMGCIFLTLGAETLAVVQWIASTLVATALFFFAVMFGEYERKEGFFSIDGKKIRLDRARALSFFVALLLAAGFSIMILFGSSPLTPEMLSLPKEKSDLTFLGATLVKDHLLSLEVLSLTLFLILVGGGVIARPQSQGEEDLFPYDFQEPPASLAPKEGKVGDEKC